MRYVLIDDIPSVETDREKNRQELRELKHKLRDELSDERIAYVPTARAYLERVQHIEQRLSALENARQTTLSHNTCSARQALNEFVTFAELVNMSDHFDVDDPTHVQGVAEAVVRRLNLLKSTVEKY